SALTLMQLDNPGAPVFYSLLPQGMMNPYTGGYYSGVPASTLLNTAGVEVGHYYDLPVLAGTFGLSVTFSGADLMVGIGLREESTMLYLPNILVDYEEFGHHKALAQGLDVNQQTLALDEIMEVGPRGHFLTQPSTKDNLRELWQPGITHKWSPEKGDFEDPQKVAKEKIDWILNNHQPEPLDPDVKEEIESIIDKAEKELSSQG
ncbi:MAG: trimethylamine methyltransferase family protein, partial [Candidatus Bipolaricaulia bacterium]